MKCPHCKEANLVMSERKGIEIDYCPECRGIWLDRGELDKILEKAKAEDDPRRQESVSQQAPYPPGYPPQQPYPPGYKYKRRKSFWEELFD